MNRIPFVISVGVLLLSFFESQLVLMLLMLMSLSAIFQDDYIHDNDALTTFNFIISTTRFFMLFCPGTMTTHAESINADLQTFTTRTALNTELKTEPVRH